MVTENHRDLADVMFDGLSTDAEAGRNVFVRRVLVQRIPKGGGNVVSTGGKPIRINGPDGSARAALLQDFNGFFVRLVQPENLQVAGGANGAPTAVLY